MSHGALFRRGKRLRLSNTEKQLLGTEIHDESGQHLGQVWSLSDQDGYVWVATGTGFMLARASL